MGTQAGGIDALVLDVDGVLTDGGLWVTEDGQHSKRFCIHDGMGLKLLLEAGLYVAIISGHASPATEARLRSLGVEDVVTGVRKKGEAFDAVAARSGIPASRIAAMGDDLNDLPMLRRAGFRVTVPGAPRELTALAHHVTKARGGHGAVREICEHILVARGAWDEVVRSFQE